jgi:hypothetical protein
MNVDENPVSSINANYNNAWLHKFNIEENTKYIWENYPNNLKKIPNQNLNYARVSEQKFSIVLVSIYSKPWYLYVFSNNITKIYYWR